MTTWHKVAGPIPDACARKNFGGCMPAPDDPSCCIYCGAPVADEGVSAVAPLPAAGTPPSGPGGRLSRA